MNLVLIDATEVDHAGRAVLTGRRAQHVARIVGDAARSEVLVGIPRRGRGRARVVHCSRDEVELLLPPAIAATQGRAPEIEIGLAVPRPKEIPRILAAIASFGVNRVDLFNAWRVEKSYLDSSKLEPDALEQALRLGCEQGAHTWLPSCHVHRRFTEFSKSVLHSRLSEGARVLVCDPAASATLAQAASQAAAVTLLFGPEGGWIDRERSTLTALGCSPVSLATPILRVYAAACAALGQIALLRSARADHPRPTQLG